MDFLSRFKGRTNFVTKDGISSLMTEASTPIEKIIEQPEFHTPRARKTKALSTQDNRRQGMPRGEIEALVSPKAASLQLKKMVDANKQHKNSNLLKIPLNESGQFEGERRMIKVGQRPEYYTPQHRLLNQVEPNSADKLSFSQRLSNLNTSKHSYTKTMQGPSYSQLHQRYPDSPGLRPEMSHSQHNQLTRFVLGRSVTESKSNYDSPVNGDLQESRIARMGFVERQEHVLNKYKPKLNVDPELYSYGGVNKSWNPNMQSHSMTPKYS